MVDETRTVTAWRRFGGKVHGSIGDRYTCCNYAIRLDTYAPESFTGQQGDQRVSVTCRHCLAYLKRDEADR